jgi:hypothetical protein
LLVGFAGVAILAGNEIGEGGEGVLGAVVAAILAPLSYGFAANYSKRKLAAVTPFVSAFGSQLFAAIVLAPGAIVYWPQTPIHLTNWAAVLLLQAPRGKPRCAVHQSPHIQLLAVRFQIGRKSAPLSARYKFISCKSVPIDMRVPDGPNTNRNRIPFNRLRSESHAAARSPPVTRCP